jgi:cysteine desulfurase / selenocysteine lyase
MFKIEFLESLGRETLWKRERERTRYALSRFKEVKVLRILGSTEPSDRISVFSFVIENRSVLDVVTTLDALGIAVRGGDLASLPVLKRLGVQGAIRASCYAYTSTAEIDQLIAALQTEPRGLS